MKKQLAIPPSFDDLEIAEVETMLRQLKNQKAFAKVTISIEGGSITRAEMSISRLIAKKVRGEAV